MANSQIKFIGTLKKTKDGFVYLDVPDDLIHGFFKAIGKDAKKPPYFTKKFNNVGAHISVMGSSESEDLKISEIGKDFEYEILDAVHLNPQKWPEMSRVWIIQVKSSQLEKLREKYGLPKKNKGHEFHITIGVKSANEGIHRLSSLYEETLEGRAYKNAMNLGSKIAKAMGLALFGKKAKARDTHKLGRGKKLKPALPPQPRINTSPVPAKPRHRKFFGIRKPQIPY